jgi:hypothetical protein
VDVGFAGPRLVVHGFKDGAGLGDVVEAADAGLVVADVLGADQSGAAGNGIFLGAGRQVVVRFAQPIDAVVSHTGHVGIGGAHLVDVVGAMLGLEAFGAEERRVTDDDVGLAANCRAEYFINFRCQVLTIAVKLNCKIISVISGVFKTTR